MFGWIDMNRFLKSARCLTKPNEPKADADPGSRGAADSAGLDILTLLRGHQPPVWVPPGESVASVRSMLSTISIDGSPIGELASYAEEDCERFLHTVALVPDIQGSLLEIGSNPYFTSLLLEKYRVGLSVEKTNYFDGKSAEIAQSVSVQNSDGAQFVNRYISRSVNVEQDTFPWSDGSFDIVLYCEVIEHLLSDPAHSLKEIWRLLKPGGLLILTTPNVARLENVARMIAGANLYDPYSGYGPYGRHNREYTRHELWRLLTYLGFEVDVLFTADVNENRACRYFDSARFENLVKFRANDLGQYIFSRWKKADTLPSMKKPSWLYRSFPPDQIESVPL